MSQKTTEASERSGAARERLLVADDQAPIPDQTPRAPATVTFGSLLLQASYWPDSL